MEQALRAEHDNGQLTDEDKDRLAVEMNLYRIRILPATDHEVGEHQDPLSERDSFVHSETGRGVVRLHGLRRAIGDERFLELMDQFGHDHAGKVVTGAEFISFINHNKRKADAIDWEIDRAAGSQGTRFTVRSWAEDQEKSVIVYGTAADVEANRETAELLQKSIAKHGTNIIVPILSDVQASASPDKIADKHVLLIGGPTTNKLSNHWRKSFPVKFDTGSFEVRKKLYAHPGSAVLAACVHPLNNGRSAMMIAGLSAESTRNATHFLLNGGQRAGNVLLLPNGARGSNLVVR